MQSNSHPHDAMMTTSQWYDVTPSKMLVRATGPADDVLVCILISMWRAPS